MTITNDEQLNEAINNEKETLILFSADWCGPCKVLKPTLEKVEESLSESYNFIKVDISDVEETTKIFNIRKVKINSILIIFIFSGHFIYFIFVFVIIFSIKLIILVFNLLQNSSDMIAPFQRSIGHSEIDFCLFFHIAVICLFRYFHGSIKMLCTIIIISFLS